MRAWPTASARPNGCGRSPCTAAAKSSSSHAYGSASGTANFSTPSGRRSSIPDSARVPRVGHEERAGVADQLELGARDHVEPAVEAAEHPARERQRSRETDVDPVAAVDPAPADPRGLTGEQPQRADAVAADVHQPTALEAGLQPHVVGSAGAEDVERERGANQPRPPDDSLARQLLQPPCLRMVAPHERLREHAARAIGGIEGRLRVLRMARQRLLGRARACPPPVRGSPIRRGASSAAARRPHRRPGRRAAPRRSRARGRSRARPRRPRRGRTSGWRPRRPRRPRRASRRRAACRLMFAVESRPKRNFMYASLRAQ